MRRVFLPLFSSQAVLKGPVYPDPFRVQEILANLPLIPDHAVPRVIVIQASIARCVGR
jgi:hypothetical protein